MPDTVLGNEHTMAEKSWGAIEANRYLNKFKTVLQGDEPMSQEYKVGMANTIW